MNTIGTTLDLIGNTPLVRLLRIPGDGSNLVLGKLEGNNPGGSVKDRPALSMIRHAEERGEIRPGDRLIEATSGNTGIALAMIAAMNELMTAARQVPWVSTRARTPQRVPISVGARKSCGRGARPRVSRTKPPRVRIPRPTRRRATRITTRAAGPSP